jgi:RecB family exonuclease
MSRKVQMSAPRVKSWSFSRYDDWCKCPLFYKFTALDKLAAQEKSPAMLRGQAVSKASEDYLLKRTKKLAPELASFTEEYEFYQAQRNLIVEAPWGFTRSWEPCKWDDWNNCWGRAKIDVGYVCLQDNELHIRDGKTGKFRARDNGKYMLQMELYAAVGIAYYPSVDRIIPRLNYTDLGITYPGVDEDDIVYTAKEARLLQKTWDKRVAPMFADTRFNPKPGPYCEWCQFSKSKGGPCKY